MTLADWMTSAVTLAERAGQEILGVYGDEFAVEHKGDGSPLTEADRRAHRCIVQGLRELTPDVPVLSEESGDRVFAERHGWRRFWLVDPLDGTKEFVKRNGEFTVNIALIDDTAPVIGVVHTPVRSMTHWAARGEGAWRRAGAGPSEPIRTRPYRGGPATVVASRSHGSSAVERFRERLERAEGSSRVESMGSSLKLCLVAQGDADVYPRLGPTSEWDTAAAHCVVEVAGGAVTRLDGSALTYNKADILNPWFLAVGDPGYDWRSLAAGLG